MNLILHTPGPWVVLPQEADKAYLRIRGSRLGQRYKVANVLLGCDKDLSAAAAEQTLANAKLIAAAPDMLVALQLVLMQIEAAQVNEQLVNRLAIKKTLREGISVATEGRV